MRSTIVRTIVRPAASRRNQPEERGLPVVGPCGGTIDTRAEQNR